MSTVETAGAHERARIQVQVYRAADGLRWRIRSSARGRRIISESSEAYVRKDDAFRGVLLTTGGEYGQTVRFPVHPNYGVGVYEQGIIQRPIGRGLVEEIFVEYLSHGTFR